MDNIGMTDRKENRLIPYSADVPDATESLPLQLREDYTVFQANRLVRAPKDDLSLMEAKFIRLVIAQVVKQDTDFQTYTCRAVDLANFFGIDEDDVYREFNKIGDSLLHKAIYMETESGTNHFSWITKTGCSYKDGMITITLNPELKPYLIGLDKLFTAYGYSVIMMFRTNRAITLYELLCSYQNMSLRKYPLSENIQPIDYYPSFINLDKDEYIFTMKWLRKYFMCEQKYRMTKDFLRYVIAEPLEVINKHTSMNASYRTVRSGRKIEYIIFKVPTYSAEAEYYHNQLMEKLRQKGYNAQEPF